MCNRVGPEGDLIFAGHFLVAGPDGNLIYEADNKEQLVVLDAPLEKAAWEQAARPWLTL